MDAQTAELYRRIVEFEMDEPGTRFSFAARLARENGWSAVYAGRVIDEYRRFALLAIAAGHPVSPSEDVDQAWHLHLTYTRSYWELFCPRVLGKPLHHNPTKGGPDEHHKFVAWYNRTLASYRAFFGHEPPSDIWPDAAKRFGPDTAHRRVNTRRNWVIPKPPLKWLTAAAAVLLASVLFVAGCSLGIRDHTSANTLHLPLDGGGGWGVGVTTAALPNPFRLAGPDFLGFFAIVLAIAALLAAAARSYLRRAPDNGAMEMPTLDPFEVAYLGGGKNAAVNAALASLVSQGALTVNSTKRRFSREMAVWQGPPLHPLEQTLFDATRELGATVENLHQDRRPIRMIADRLKSLGLVVPDGRAQLGRVLPVLIMVAVVILGAARIVQGVSREKPVGILVVACIAAVVALALFSRTLHRTHRGDRVLAKIRTENAVLDPKGKKRRRELAGPDLALALGLFGISVLSTTPLMSLHNALKPPKNAHGHRNDGGGSGDTAGGGGCGCSGGGGSGGSGCSGGGGGCGGGCGGCGGCGGG